MINKIEKMKLLENQIKTCRSCRLCEMATNAVVGEGSLDAQIVFIGEAPGEAEDLSGRPFVGRAGKLLSSLIEEIGLSREQVWIGNIIKHRPPANRDPMQDEIEACSPFLEKQLEIIKPKLIVTLGRFSMSFFYSSGKITHHHGVLIHTPKYKIFPVYHPAAALRNPTFDRALKEDFRKIPKVLESILLKSDNKYENKEPNNLLSDFSN